MDSLPADDEPSIPSQSHQGKESKLAQLTTQGSSTDSDYVADDDALTENGMQPLVERGEENTERLARLGYARVLLYTSHFFAQFSDFTWQFCITLFLEAFTNYQSLMLVSTYGFATGLTVCLFGSLAGRFIDDSGRLFVLRVFIISENICCVLASIFCYMLLSRDINADSPEGPKWLHWFLSRLDGVPLDPVSIVLLVGIHLLGSICMLLNQGLMVAVERDWIVVMSKLASPRYGTINLQNISDPESTRWLSGTNVVMKQIDLTSQIGAPAAAGLLLSLFNAGITDVHGQNLRSAAVLVGSMNAAALVVEYICTFRIYQLVPDLAKKHVASAESLQEEEEDAENPSETDEIWEIQVIEDSQQQLGSCGFCRLPHGLRVYLKQTISLGGIGFALLYLNSLTFGGLMTAYLIWRGMSFGTVGVLRGVSSAIGLLGTVVYHFSARIMSVETTGMWSVTFQFCCLTASYASLFVHDFKTSVGMLVGGVIISRVGLWVFDVAVTVIMQQHIPADVRGVTGGVQKALNAFFGLFAFVLGIIFPNPKQFHFNVAAGYASVGIAMVLYAIGIFFRQDKLRPPENRPE